ncbi:MAG: lipid A 3-O-deacylase, partial [Alphaproteobacteria bacterium]
VDKKPFVADIQAGAAIVVHDIRLAFTHVFRTREFEGQRRADSYGAISLSVKF